MDKNHCLVVIDGNSLFNRAFYALPPLNNSKGELCNAVFGFATMLIKAITDINPKYLVVTFDRPEKTFRHKMYDGYKATRKGMPDELAQQFPKLKAMIDAMGIKRLEFAGFEADDIIGTLTKKFDIDTMVITGDKDALQLIGDRTQVWLTKHGISQTDIMTERSLIESTGLKPSQIVDYKALCGDSSDNIPGVAGIGDKTATALLIEYNDLDNLYNNLDKLTPKLKEKLEKDKENAYLSRELATINCSMPLDLGINELSFDFPFSESVLKLFNEWEFKTLIRREDLFMSEQVVSEQFIAKSIAINSLDNLKLAMTNLKAALAITIDDERLCFAVDNATHYELKFRQTLLDDGLTSMDAFAFFKPFLNDEGIVKICFDAKALMHRLYKHDITLNNFFDCQLAQYILDVTTPFDEINKCLAFCGLSTPAVCAALMELYQQQRVQIAREGHEALYYDIELKLVKVLFDMERTGFRVDLDILDTLNRQYKKEIEELSKEIYKEAGAEFNINSPKQLGVILFESLGIPYPKKQKKGGNYSTSAEILEMLYDAHPIVKLIMRYRTVFKLNSTYIEGMKKLINPDGRVRTTFKQALTTTGRLSSVEPNLQNIPIRESEGRLLRKSFIASENNTLVMADYSQIELRLLAHFSHDKHMVEAYNRGDDIHAATAAQVFSVKLDEVTPQMRRAAKAVNFGIIYGMSDFGLAQSLDITRNKAKEYIKNYFRIYTDIKEYLDNSVKTAKECGYAETLFGRKRKLPELNGANYIMRSFGERAAMNMPLQGTAADLMKRAMVRVHDRLSGMQSKLILQVHDELIIDAVPSEVESIKTMLKFEMENALKLSVPLVAEVKSGKNWLDAE